MSGSVSKKCCTSPVTSTTVLITKRQHPRLSKTGLAPLERGSLVTGFDEDTHIARIIACHPDVLVKGGDWPVAKIVGNQEVAGWGGRVVSIPFIHQQSTTALLDKIRSL